MLTGHPFINLVGQVGIGGPVIVCNLLRSTDDPFKLRTILGAPLFKKKVNKKIAFWISKLNRLYLDFLE